MRLNVIQSDPSPPGWYSAGLQFSCTQCGNCCTGPPGAVWISADEIRLMAEYLHLTEQKLADRYLRKIGDRFSLREVGVAGGSYDCVFLKAADGGRKICSVYPVRPLQCRTWPFWTGSLQSPQAWSAAAQNCPGMNHGRRYSSSQIEALRDADAWPEDPPTSP